MTDRPDRTAEGLISPASEQERSGVEPRPHRGILVVVPDPDLQWRLTRTLTIVGNRVVGTSSGDGALALIAEWPVDLVLIDEDLPRMDGLEVVRRLRACQPDIAIVLLTTGEDEEIEVTARLAGAVACLHKPFRMDELEDLLMSLRAGESPEPDVDISAAE